MEKLDEGEFGVLRAAVIPGATASLHRRHSGRKRQGMGQGIPNRVGRQGRRRRPSVAALCLALCLAMVRWVSPLFAQQPHLLDGFEDPALWQAGASDGVRASLHAVAGLEGQALCLDFDFAGVAGYASARRALPIDFPPNYEFFFYVRGDAPVNNLEFKLIDASGDNVWWVNRRDFEFPREWQLVKIKKRQIEFAWGPTPDRALKHSAALELVLKAGSGGGRGSVCFDQLSFRELPAETTSPPTPVLQATSAQPGAEPAYVLDGALSTAWKSNPAAGAEQMLTVDFQQPREFGGLVLHWLDNAFASRYDVEFSEDGSHWRTVRTVVDGNGGRDALYLPESETRFLRLVLHDGPARAYGLAEIDVKDLAFGASPNAFFEAIAREAPRGHFPRGFSGEQSYWTVVGIDGGAEEGLLSEDGALEVGKAGFSIEPFVLTGSELLTWADVRARHALLDAYLPIPTVAWQHRELAFQTTAFATGSTERSRLIVSYDVQNLSERPQTVTLVLAVRPFQVNPPSQFLNTPGGVSPIRELVWDGEVVSVNGVRRIFPLGQPDAFGAASFDAGSLPELLAANAWPEAPEVRDAFGYASGALVYRLRLPPHEGATTGLLIPLSGPALSAELTGMSPRQWLQRERDAVTAVWRAKLNRVSFRVPPAAQPLIDTLRTALAHVLINRHGPALQPGARSYQRSWIRDGALTSEALLQLGHGDVVRDFLRWYAPYQFPNGKVPCCVDARGADPVPENDSHGEFIFLVSELYRYTHDRSLLAAMWPYVEAAAGYMEILRQSERGAANLAPERRAFYGLLPASISHEGYWQKPMHSYWDDFWALKGYKEAVAISAVLGHQEATTRLARQRDEFRHDVYASLAASTVAHGISYLPGCAELGDFDATSTTIALAPIGEQAHLPQDLLLATFERYWQAFVGRRDGEIPWDDYTPYELRTVGTFVRLGWRTRTQELLDFFFADRRPPGWNQWAEVVGRELRQPRFVGDMPHGWVASDFIRSALDLFAYERDADSALVLGAGLPLQWLEGEGVAVENLRTPYGRLNYSLHSQGSRLILEVAAGLQPPPGGLVFIWPGAQPAGPTRLNGKHVSWQGAELRIRQLPAEVIVGD
jgi:F5/8 type C domain